MRSSLASRLKAFSPPQLALVALGSLALAGAGTAAAASLIAGADERDGSITGGDQDLAGGKVIHGNVDGHRIRALKIKRAQAQSSDRNDRPSAADGLRTDPISGNGGAAAPAGGGGGGASAGGGPKGDTGGAGPEGNTGGAGPKGDTGGSGPKTGDAGGAGPKGDTGGAGPKTDPAVDGNGGAPTPIAAPPTPQGAPAPVAVPAVLVVKDADGITAGPLTSPDPNAASLTFLYKERTFVANTRTGALELPKIDTSYATDDCTGTPYALLSRPAKSALLSANPSETGIYEFSQPVSLDVRSIWESEEDGSGRCLKYAYTTDVAPLRELSASDRPPTLSGPLKAVRAS